VITCVTTAKVDSGWCCKQFYSVRHIFMVMELDVAACSCLLTESNDSFSFILVVRAVLDTGKIQIIRVVAWTSTNVHWLVFVNWHLLGIITVIQAHDHD
jgi:hypothetical protein